MDHSMLFLLLAVLSVQAFTLLAQPTANPVSQITVEGSVYCDPCFTNEFSKHSYFMSGADVHIQCRLKASPPGTAEIITFSVNRTTNRDGVFRLRIPHVDGVDCVEGPPIQFSCQAILIRSSTSSCNIPTSRTTTYQLSVKSKQADECVYGFPGLSFRPIKRNDTLCGGKKTDQTQTSSNPSKVYGFPKSFTFPFLNSPPFRFPIPQRPFNPQIPFLFSSPPPPAFRLNDPRTWLPNNPFQSPPAMPPPPPMVNPWDPRTWPPLRSPPPPFAGPLKKKP